MGTGISVLAEAVSGGVDFDTIGLIMVVAGLLTMLCSLVFWDSWPSAHTDGSSPRPGLFTSDLVEGRVRLPERNRTIGTFRAARR